MKLSLPILILLLASTASAADRPDIVIADFEGDTYGDGWKTTGTAFGTGPAKGTLPNQMPVSGHLGKGLVNSFLGGDAATGTLTSTPFKIERKYLNFLVGGGKQPGKTCVNLLVGGKVVRTATGPNDKPGGSERLDWHTWDVGELEGKEAVLEFVDQATGGWGHINADQFVLSDKKKQAEPIFRTFAIDKAYLHLPVKNGAPLKRMRFAIGGETVREFDIELADGEKPDWWAFAEVGAFKGKTLSVETVLPSGSTALRSLKLADEVPDVEKLYREKYRPLFHFTSRVGWLNDPNGLVFLPGSTKPKTPLTPEGEWHLFYQHNPFGVQWGNMHWGHAVSEDLMHWKELGIGLYPKKYGDWAFSGSAVYDKENTSGWGTKENPPLVLAYTSTARGECIAHSTDRGRSWTEYDKNPVLKHSGRDPKLVWYEKGKHWVMAVYDEYQGKQWIAFHTSPDLKTWTFASRIEGFFECPDLLEVFDRLNRSRWVLYAADGKYLIGEFDGKKFKPASKEKKQLWYGHFYAAQTFSNSSARWPVETVMPPFGPLGGHPMPIQIGWANGVTFPGMPFNQQMTIPVGFELWHGDKDIRLRAQPYGVERLYAKEGAIESRPTSPPAPGWLVTGNSGLASGEAYDLMLELAPLDAKKVTFDLRGTMLIYDASKQTLTCKDVSAPVKLIDNRCIHPRKRLNLRILVDRGSIEVFADDGLVAMSIAAIADEKKTGAQLSVEGGEIAVFQHTSHQLKSAWLDQPTAPKAK